MELSNPSDQGFRHHVLQPAVRSAARLAITNLAWRMRRSGSSDYPMGHATWSFLQFHDPVEIDGRPCPPETLVVYRPGSAMRFGSTAGDWCHTWFHAGGPAVGGLLAGARLPCDRPLPLGDGQAMERCVLDLHAELSVHADPDAELLEAVLTQLVRRLARCVVPARTRPIPVAFVECRAFIEAHYHQRLTLAGLGRRVGLSPTHFASRFRRLFGVSPVALAMRLRLTEAAQLLLDANLAVGTVATRVGIDDPCRFSKLFRTHHGVGPQAWRSAQFGAASVRSRRDS